MRTFNSELVKFFNISIQDVAPAVDYVKLNEEAMKAGYIVLPEAANTVTRDFIRSISGNLNSTFYKNWNDVTSKCRFELLLDQLVHYITTYGTDFTSEGNGYVPNDSKGEYMDFSFFKDYKVIRPCTEEDMYERCLGMVCSSIALKGRTLKVIVNYIVEYVDTCCCDFDIDLITNKEAIAMICSGLGIAPNRKFDLLRYIIYRTTGEAMIIKNKRLIDLIKKSDNKFDLRTLSQKQLIGLASMFHRFKPLFLAFKKDISRHYSDGQTIKELPNHNTCIINKLRRMAVKYHQPLEESVGATLLSRDYPQETVTAAALQFNNYKIISLLNTIKARLSRTDENQIYIIRNGKIFVNEGKDYTPMGSYYAMVYNTLAEELVCRLVSKACYVRYNDAIDLACPTSEKNFIGDIPFGSTMNMDGSDAFFGIYWRNEWGTRYFDLSLLDLKEHKVGWNAGYFNREQSVVYSGDMTDADPEATEILLFKQGMPDGIININRYFGADDSKFRIFAGTQKDMPLSRNYMVDPGYIKMQTDCTSGRNEQMIGLVLDKTMYFISLGSGDSIVSYHYGDYTTEMFRASTLKAASFIKVKDILTAAGFIDASTVEEIPEDASVLDLRELSRDTLIQLFR